MQFKTTGTLDYYRSAPYFRPIKLTDIPLASVMAEVKKAHGEWDQASPDTEAAEFYCLNHLMHLLEKRFTPYEVLPEWAQFIASDYLKCLKRQSKRIFYYTMLICLRESRHTGDSNNTTYFEDFKGTHKAWGTAFDSVLKTHPDGGSMAKDYLNHPELHTGTLGEFFDSISAVFNTLSWGGSMGGKKWGKITDCLREFIHGKVSAEVFIDTSYTLAHNTGSMFNKGMMYTHYSDYFTQVLDVQHSGQIPELLIDSIAYSPSINILNPVHQRLKTHVLVVKAMLGGIDNWIDWEKVTPKIKNSGVSKHYADNLTKQQATHGFKDGSWYYSLGYGKKFKMTKHEKKIEGANTLKISPTETVYLYDEEEAIAA